MKVLVTGAAGFIGSALSIKLLERGDEVCGIDNHNDYYDPSLKEARLTRHLGHSNYSHFRMDITDRNGMAELFKLKQFHSVINLAAQAGVRYSIDNPMSYIDSNLLGFANVIEGCRHNKVSHLVYASSSSVYGLNLKQPFSTQDSVNHPVSLYAATKKANELMAHSYSHLYNLPTTGLRFFTVYGPYDRPDMALQKFTRAIVNNSTIKVHNYGNHSRDFTYIDDIVDAIIKVIDRPALRDLDWNGVYPSSDSSSAPWRLYNIGNSNPVKLLDYIDALENSLGLKAKKELLPLQAGDVPETFADISSLAKDFNYKPQTEIDVGIQNFVNWYKSYHHL
jgi:UDP-glucuronate 4-epimerase